MSAPAVVWLVVGLVSVLAITAAVIALVRHVLLLGRALRRFQEDVTPAAEEIGRQAERAGERTSRLQGPDRRRTR